MSNRFVQFIRRKLQGEPKLTPLDRRAAKFYVKQRLQRIFPELQNDPVALERVYRELSIEPREGQGEGGATLFEIILDKDRW